MKKIPQTLGIALALLLLIAPQLVSALEIEIRPNGQMIFYQGSVLGKGSDSGSGGSSDDRDDDRDDDQDDDQDEDQYDDDNDTNETRFRQEIKTINPWERKELKVRSRDDRVEIEIKERNKDSQLESKFENKEETETDELELRFSARDGATEETAEEQLVGERIKNYREKLLQERQERREELVELKNRITQGTNELALKSRTARASLSEGASFILDPDTNRVTIVTPSGEEHTLYHLPDQAVTRMQEAGLLSSTAEGELKEAIIDTADDGGLVYKVRDVERKRLFGLFGRSVPVEVELDDDTGEVVERLVEDRTLFEKFLDSVSF